MIDSFIKKHKLLFLATVIVLLIILTFALYPALMQGQQAILILFLLLTGLTMAILMRYG